MIDRDMIHLEGFVCWLVNWCINDALNVSGNSGIPGVHTGSTGGSSGSNRSFINKPARGWLHSDQVVVREGITYFVRVILNDSSFANLLKSHGYIPIRGTQKLLIGILRQNWSDYFELFIISFADGIQNPTNRFWRRAILYLITIQNLFKAA